MEEVMKQVKLRCKFEIWYKLYADDLVLMVKHNEVKDLISILSEVSKDF